MVVAASLPGCAASTNKIAGVVDLPASTLTPIFFSCVANELLVAESTPTDVAGATGACVATFAIAVFFHLFTSTGLSDAASLMASNSGHV